MFSVRRSILGMVSLASCRWDQNSSSSSNRGLWPFYKMQHFVPKNVYDVLHPGLLSRKERILYPKNVLDVLLLLLSLVFFGSFVLKALVYSEKNNDFKGISVVKSEDMRVSKVSCKKVTELQGKRIFGLSDIFEAHVMTSVNTL